MSENIIYCFSGTGNCLDMAKNIARALGDTDIVSLRGVPAVTDAREAKRVGFVFPCHGGGLPGDMAAQLRQIHVRPTAYTFGVCQYAGYMGEGLYRLDEIIRLDYWTAVSHQCAAIWLLPHGVMLPPMTPVMAQRRAEKKAAEIAAAVAAQERSGKRPPRRALNAAEHRAWPMLVKGKAKRFTVSDACVGCGQCVRLCPRGNIRVENGRAVLGADCVQCLSCLQYCPQQAISIGRVTDRRAHYHNPHVTAAELCQPVLHVD